jgi:hypothetical protein
MKGDTLNLLCTQASSSKTSVTSKAFQLLSLPKVEEILVRCLNSGSSHVTYSALVHIGSCTYEDSQGARRARNSNEPGTPHRNGSYWLLASSCNCGRRQSMEFTTLPSCPLWQVSCGIRMQENLGCCVHEILSSQEMIFRLLYSRKRLRKFLVHKYQKCEASLWSRRQNRKENGRSLHHVRKDITNYIKSHI